MAEQATYKMVLRCRNCGERILTDISKGVGVNVVVNEAVCNNCGVTGQFFAGRPTERDLNENKSTIS